MTGGGPRAAGQVTGDVVDVTGRTVEVVIPYNTRDSYGTVWLPGCFTRSLQRRLPPVVMNHDAKTPVGRVTSYRDTATALHLTIQLADPAAVPDARAAQSLLRDHVIDEVSFRYVDGVAVPDRRFGNSPCFRSATVQEVSFVTIGSIPGARVLSVRSAAAVDDELTDEELAILEEEATRGYSSTELHALRQRQALDLEVRAALTRLDGMAGHRPPLSVADIRSRAAVLPRPVDPKTQRENERRRRELEQLDRIPPSQMPPVLSDPPPFKPTPRDPAAIPAELLDLAAKEAAERGENVGEALRAADANWRASYGAMYAATARRDNTPVMSPTGVIDYPYPPQDLLDVAAQTASDRGITAQQATDECIRGWRIARGFEEV